MSAVHRRSLAAQFVAGEVEAPASHGTARLMRATIKSGKAANQRDGIAHAVHSVAFVVDEAEAVLAARWECGATSVNASPVVLDAPYAACHHCAEATRHPRGPVVYRCYSAEGELLYIGSSIKLYQRLRSHRSSTPWWGEVAKVKSEAHPTEADARLAEAVAIAHERPPYNRAGIPQTPAAPPQQAARHP